MDYEPARIGLIRRRHDLPVLAQAIHDDSQIGRLVQGMVESLYACQRLRRAVEALARQQRRPQAVARCVADAEALCRRAESLAEAGRLRGSTAKRPHHLPLVEPKKLAAPGRGAEHAAGRGDVPAPVIMAGRDRKTNARLHFVAEDEGEQQLGPAHLSQLGEREQCRRHRRGRMDHRPHMGIAEVVDVGARCIEECCGERIEALAASDHGRLLPIRKFLKRAQRHFDGCSAAAGECHRKEVHQRAFSLMRDCRWNVFPSRRNNETCKILRNA